MVAFGVGSILFAWIERLWPDSLTFDSVESPGRESVRFAVSTLLVAFPVYLFTARLTGRAVARDPEKRNSSVRRWLTYLTLFNAACMLIGDFIVVVQGALKGELTARFASKAAVVAVIGGWLFAHYMGGLKRDEEDQPRRPGPSWLARSAGIAVVLVAVLGLTMAGAPAHARRQVMDQRRLYDLQTLSGVAIEFHGTNRRLPRDLDELTSWRPQVTTVHVTDPASRRRYEYVLRDSLAFDLCATFDGADSTGPYGDQVQPFWRHGAGRACFTFRVVSVPPGR